MRSNTAVENVLPRPNRLFHLPVALATGAFCLVGCSGSSAPPPPVPPATTAPAAQALAPLSSRDSAPPAAAQTGATAPASAALPPGHPPLPAADPHGNIIPKGQAQARPTGSVSGTISLAPNLKAASSDVLYVIAKKGTKTLAARRLDKPAFPVSFEISGKDTMTAGVGFEGPVDLVARLSRSGDAIPSKGDLEGIKRGVAIPSKGVAIRIDSVRP